MVDLGLNLLNLPENDRTMSCLYYIYRKDSLADIKRKGIRPIMSFTNQDRSYPVGAQFIGAPPIYRPMARRCAPQADNEFYQVTSVIPVGAQCIGAPPIYRPMARRCAPQADKSAMCTINRHLRCGRLCAADAYRFSVDLLAAYCVQQVLFHTFDVPVDRETLPHGCLRGL